MPRPESELARGSSCSWPMPARRACAPTTQPVLRSPRPSCPAGQTARLWAERPQASKSAGACAPATASAGGRQGGVVVRSDDRREYESDGSTNGSTDLSPRPAARCSLLQRGLALEAGGFNRFESCPTLAICRDFVARSLCPAAGRRPREVQFTGSVRRCCGRDAPPSLASSAPPRRANPARRHGNRSRA